MADLLYHRNTAGMFQRRIILLICFVIFVFLSWAASFSIDEVAIGQGRVIPSSKTQLVQTVQGGRLIEIKAKEGEIVEAGQLLAVLDTTQFEAELAEVQAAVLEAEAQQQVLNALLADQDRVVLTGDVIQSPELVQQKTALFQKILNTHLQAVTDIRTELDLLKKERDILDQARINGGSTEIELLRLDQRIAATNSRLNEELQSYKSDLQLKLDDVNKAVQQLNIRLSGMKGTMTGSELRSPTRGVVQKIPVSTEGGGVLPPNGTVMEIVPIEERLLIEARFSPRDIAFISPDLKARIKVTAYDYAIFGDLEARVLRVSPDSIQYEGRPGEYYFAVTLESTKTYFDTPDGKQLAIMPGMVTTTEIVTGSRTILQYLLKPLGKATDALRER
jgi:membrane fusion protein, adhesin transport system